ncbi:hypothetical protein [Leekyejoonella antrihumi]|uniref:LppX_LprAFG lipoprotein n=1 Tax=Leekyejoonella antrihumi TaxID=1660198 RepID=A0A563E9D9_9MICO|nr:hypothetical protein [Leekyejoonella antrihumi]TWP39065.1 hypothetical protein FGL98_01375 [Leekyejoonella antrihumi]
MVSLTRCSRTCVLTVVVAAGLVGCGSSGSGPSGPVSSGSSSGSGSSSSPASSGPSSTGSSAAAAGGGEAGKSATQVFADAKSALFNAKSVRVSGTVIDHGQQQKVNLRFQGDNTAGTETIGGMVINIVKIGSTAYIKAPASFWTKTAGSKAAGLAGKWIKSTGTSNALGALTLQSLAADLNSSGSPIRSGITHTTLHGKKALTLTQKDGSTLTVADAASPVPLQIVNKSAASKGQLDFTGYGVGQHITAPKGAVTATQALKGQKATA